MRITAARGDHTVTIEIDGADPKLLRLAEESALRLLGDPPKRPAKAPLGFAGSKRSSQPSAVTMSQ